MDFESIRGAFARRGIDTSSALGPVMGRRSNYARPVPPLTSVAAATLQTSCRRTVRLDRKDRDKFIAAFAGRVPAPFVAGNGKGNVYVRCSPPPSAGMSRGNTVTLARLLLGDAAVGAIIRYKDRDPFNLCRDNLLLVRDGRTTLAAEVAA